MCELAGHDGILLAVSRQTRLTAERFSDALVYAMDDDMRVVEEPRSVDDMAVQDRLTKQTSGVRSFCQTRGVVAV